MHRRIAHLSIAVIVALSLVAWVQPLLEAPYTGTFYSSSRSNGIRTNARSVKWDSAGVYYMQQNGWGDAYYDQTADCTANSPQGDKMRADYVVTSTPNYGAFAYDDCDGPLPNGNEEIELTINDLSVVAQTSYQYDVVWRCKAASVSGEINITFELGAWGPKGWQDKVTYNLGNCQGPFPTVAQEAFLLSPTSTDSSLQPPEIISTVTGSGETVQYQALRTSQGTLRARAQVNFIDEDRFRAYREFNVNMATTLQAEVANAPVLSVVTFAAPLAVDEVRALAELAGLEVISYGAFGTNTSGEQVSVYVWPETQTVEELPAIRGIKLKGIMTITALVKPEASGLGMLLSDKRITLVDVSANQIKAKVEAELGESIEVTQIGVPNPAWLIIAGTIKTP